MINYWWVTRPKRKLNSVPEVLTTFAELSLDEEWQGQRGTHLSLEEALEQAGLKRVGERRDQTGGGARTYKAWIKSLGLIFTQESTGQIKLTLAGDAIMAGASPVKVLKNQILKYQFPSSFSIGRGVKMSPRFKIRPFRFLLRLLSDERLDYYVTEEEIAKIVITEADKETSARFNYVVERIIQFRNVGDSCLEIDYFDKYGPSKGKVNPDHPFSHLKDTANTLINWIEYTQLAKRNDSRQLVVLYDKKEEVAEILATNPAFIARPEEHEYFQRKYGVDPEHTKDTRNLTATRTVTHTIIAEQKIKQAFISESLKKPIGSITAELVDKIVDMTGIDANLVEESLQKFYPHGAIGSFMTEYFEMAFRGRDNAIEFELATVEIFKNVFGLRAEHVGPVGLTPDVLVLSDSDRFVGIIDNKAYSKYSITNDHRNRMIHNYIETYRESEYPLEFFSYISGGFGNNINSQIQSISDDTGVNGSAISVSNMIKLVENYEKCGYNHNKIKEVFSLNRQVLLSDLS